eukprot:c4975_g1_i2.p2 GENE.c4975_g1_i2~~c4975_g1_i2.p2  ORF type:complete len:111 (+),score=15.92 c4975_g1_i2:243-575(+)
MLKLKLSSNQAARFPQAWKDQLLNDLRDLGAYDLLKFKSTTKSPIIELKLCDEDSETDQSVSKLRGDIPFLVLKESGATRVLVPHENDDEAREILETNSNINQRFGYATG